MDKRLVFPALIFLLIAVAACSSASGVRMTSKEKPTPIVTPASPAAPISPLPTPQSTANNGLISECRLLDSRDLASLYSSAEVVGPTRQVGQVSQPIFATQAISVTETSCIDYVFHLPGSKDMQMLQVTYWVDVPAREASGAWAEVWAASSAKGTPAAGVGESAFYDNGRLTFEQDNLVVTVEVVGTELDPATATGASQQKQMEKRLALDILGRLNP